MDEKFSRRFASYTKSLDALAEARERDLSDSFAYQNHNHKYHLQ